MYYKIIYSWGREESGGSHEWALERAMRVNNGRTPFTNVEINGKRTMTAWAFVMANGRLPCYFMIGDKKVRSLEEALVIAQQHVARGEGTLPVKLNGDSRYTYNTDCIGVLLANDRAA